MTNSDIQVAISDAMAGLPGNHVNLDFIDRMVNGESPQYISYYAIIDETSDNP